MSSATEPAAPRRGFDLVAYLKLFRFPLVFTAIADSATGAFIGKFEHPEWKTNGLLAVASAGLYFFGMSLNDIADRKRDQELAPGRMLPSGRLTLRSASIACTLALLTSLAALFLIQGPPLFQRVAVWGATVFFISAYNLFLKIPPTMGLVRAGNLLLGLCAVQDLAQIDPHNMKLLVAMLIPTFVYVTALTYVSTLEDATLDRRRLWVGAGFMVVGAGLASFVIVLTYYLGFIVPEGWPQLYRYVPVSWRASVLSAILSAWVIRRALAARDKKGVMLLVRDGVGGIIVLDAALAASPYPEFGGADSFVPLLIAALILPAILSVAIFKKLA